MAVVNERNPESGGLKMDRVSAQVDPADGGQTLLYVLKESIPWHHRGKIWGLTAAAVLLSGLAAGFFLTRAFSGDYDEVDPMLITLQRSTNETLRKQVAKLEQVTRGNICLPGALNDPDLGGSGVAAEPSAGPPLRGALTSTQLLNSLQGNTANVEAAVDTRSAKWGTGFFIGPDILVTNAHVIEGTLPDKITVKSDALGPRPLPAQLLVSSGTLQTDGRDYAAGQLDFAILRVPGANRTSPLRIRTAVVKPLADVTAAGYPGYERDIERSMQERDDTMPSLIPTAGKVKVIRNTPRFSTSIVEHSAPIAQGNSGGPLVDACGNLAGVNTFVSEIPESADQIASQIRLQYALSAQTLREFLQQKNIPFRATDDTCS